MLRYVSATLAAAALLTALPTVAQVGHPAKGSWIGYWGPGAEDRNRMLLVLDWEDREISGVINPGRRSAPIESARIDYESWTMTLEAMMPTGDGTSARFVAVGKLENLGSWVNRRYSGTYTLGDETGTFSLTLN